MALVNSRSTQIKETEVAKTRRYTDAKGNTFNLTEKAAKARGLTETKKASSPSTKKVAAPKAADEETSN